MNAPDATTPQVVMPNVIAIDGLSASGKGTLAKKLAQYFGFAHLDTGKIYRLIGFLLLQQCATEKNQIMWSSDGGAGDMGRVESLLVACLDSGEEKMMAVAEHVIKLFRLMDSTVGDGATNPYQDLLLKHRKELASDEVAMAASLIAKRENLRTLLKSAQRAFGLSAHKKGTVIDGRDIGTVIFPDAPIKFFVVADVAVRADRRCLELQSYGLSASKKNILADLEWRDRMDKERKVAPLKPAEDAVTLDSSQSSPDELLEKALFAIKQKKLFGLS